MTLEQHAAAISAAVKAAADEGYFLVDGDGDPAEIDLTTYDDGYQGDWAEIAVPASR